MPSEPAVPAGGPAFATVYVPGEQQPNVDLSRGTWGILPEAAGQIVAQTFTPANSGWLGYLELPVGCATGVLLNVKVREGLGGAIMFETNVANLPQHIDGSFQLIQVFDPATGEGLELHRGHVYAFELAAFVGPDAKDTECGIAKGPAGDSYSGGRSYYKEPSMPAFAPLPNGLPKDDEDLPFVTLVG
jgi:hypothetical protein